MSLSGNHVRAFVELNVAPSWWSDIHHQPRGAFIITVGCLLDELSERKIEVLELHATEESLTVTLPLNLNDTLDQNHFDRLAESIQAHLERNIEIEPTDRKTTVKPEPAKSEPPAKPVTRVDVEERLRACGFVQSSSLQLPDRKADDKDIWSLPDTASRCVQFDEATQPGDTGKARWMTPSGERVLPFDRIIAELDIYKEVGEPATTDLPEGQRGIFPGDGEAHGGVFGKDQQ